MSVLTNKHLLVVGEETSQIKELEKVLRDFGMVIEAMSCADANFEKLEAVKADIIILNYLDNGSECKELINVLRSVDATKGLPVFALVDDNEFAMQEVLTAGVADYLTPNEDVHSMVQKIKTVFGQGGDFSGSSVIDITPARPSTSTKGIKVYIVEDDPLLRNLLSVCLQKLSFPHEFSSDGHEALIPMRQFRPDVIILDLMLPGKSGFEILEEIKADETLKEIPVIVFSNRDGQDDRKKAKQLGAVGFYVKAMTDLSELAETIEKLVR